MITAIEFALAFGADCMIGDPRWMPHPVRIIGRLISVAESVLINRVRGITGGIVLVVVTVGGTYLTAFYLMQLIRALPWPWLSSAMAVFIASTTLAARGLVCGVTDVFKSGDLTSARKSVSMIVGRDTDNLDINGVRKAALESLAENASDGIIAPMFYLAMGGVPLAMAYKAVNTLDSMVGHKNERYILFGRASARLDDAMNFIPARITGILMVLASLIVLGYDAAKRAWRVMIRDGQNHTSPNSGVPESAMAGALDLRFGGPSSYCGVMIDKPFINEQAGGDYSSSIRHAIPIVAASSALMLVISASGLWIWQNI